MPDDLFKSTCTLAEILTITDGDDLRFVLYDEAAKALRTDEYWERLATETRDALLSCAAGEWRTDFENIPETEGIPDAVLAMPKDGSIPRIEWFNKLCKDLPNYPPWLAWAELRPYKEPEQ